MVTVPPHIRFLSIVGVAGQGGYLRKFRFCEAYDASLSIETWLVTERKREGCSALSMNAVKMR